MNTHYQKKHTVASIYSDNVSHVAQHQTPIKFGDITTRYIYVLFGLFAHIYIISSSSVYFALEGVFEETLGVQKDVIVNYFAFLSIILLLVSLALKWTWPIKVEECLIVILLWVLLRNLLPRECLCCGASTCVDSLWFYFNIIYSVLCVCVMIASFMMHAQRYAITVFFTIVAIGLMIITTLIPVSCNQFDHTNINTNLLKFTLYSIVWFVNRRMRLTEQVLTNQYIKSLHILYTHAHYTGDEDRIYHNNAGEDDCSIPTILFKRLESLSHSIIQQQQRNKREGKNGIGIGRLSREEVHKRTTFRAQLNNLARIHRIHREYKEKRWFGGFFSWKNRFYDTEVLNIFDLTKTLWILNVCPIFLVFTFIEYFLILYQTKRNIDELQRLIQVVELMDSLYKQRELVI